MKEIVVISGKGGTGKTSIVAAFAALAKDKVLADCDVDAADLHLVLAPRVVHEEEFTASQKAFIIEDKCVQCGKCRELCRFDAISEDFVVDKIACEGCGVCAYFCPEKAIEMRSVVSGRWFISDTRHGPMVHARLGVGEENSGKLVTLVRTQAKKLGEERGMKLVIVDGSPGIGCPVIASVTGTDLAVVVTEPTMSGIHDMTRAVQLARHFDAHVAVCINKHDLNPQMTEKIERFCAQEKLKVAGKIPYDPVVTKAQLMGVSVVEYSGGLVAQEMEKLWRHVVYELG